MKRFANGVWGSIGFRLPSSTLVGRARPPPPTSNVSYKKRCWKTNRLRTYVPVSHSLQLGAENHQTFKRFLDLHGITKGRKGTDLSGRSKNILCCFRDSGKTMPPAAFQFRKLNKRQIHHHLESPYTLPLPYGGYGVKIK